MIKKMKTVLRLFAALLILTAMGNCSKKGAPLPNPDPDPPTPPAFPVYDYVFGNATHGYSCFRIPALIKIASGDMLAFAEGRKNSCDDNGNIDLVMKRSPDKGKTWIDFKVVVDNGIYKAASPAPVIDYLDPNYPDGRIFLFYNTITDYQNSAGSTKRVTESWNISSTDDGKTWSQPVNMTTQVHRPFAPEYKAEYNFPEKWSSSINTPGHALQLKRGMHAGRIYVAANHAFTASVSDYSNYRSYGYYSDDHGNNWQIGMDIDMPGGNESIAAELSDGTLLQNIRYQNVLGIKRRILATSKSSGHTWDSVFISEELIDPICQGSMLDIEYKGEPIVLFSNPASETKREKMTIKASKNNGISWPHSFLVDNDLAAYSDLAPVDQQTVGILYERGNTGGIVFKTVNLADILKN
jgi:sialidase-1